MHITLFSNFETIVYIHTFIYLCTFLFAFKESLKESLHYSVGNTIIT